MRLLRICPIWVFSLALGLLAVAQAAQTTPPPTSPEVESNRGITFRIVAPNATTVKLTGSDFPGLGAGKDLVKGSNGVWSVTLGPVAPGSYRYHFQVDSVAVVDGACRVKVPKFESKPTIAHSTPEIVKTD